MTATKNSDAIDIQPARPGDEQAVCDLIHALAHYEKAPGQCHATPELLRQHLFGDHPIAFGLVARIDGKTVAAAVYFLTFPTWPCKPCVHLEDLFVLPEYRQRGIGGAMLRRLAGICVEKGYERLEWTCLEWNELAKAQYRKIGAKSLDEWRIWRLDGEALNDLGKEGKLPGAHEAPSIFSPEETDVHIYTDGGCEPNPGIGAWAAVLIRGGHHRELVGGEKETTNNRMELLAAINALEALKRPCRVFLHTDSQYVRNGITKWIHSWKKKNWMRGKEPVKNVDLWKRLERATSRHEIEWKWIRGHTGDTHNERCDELCAAEIARLRSS